MHRYANPLEDRVQLEACGIEDTYSNVFEKEKGFNNIRTRREYFNKYKRTKTLLCIAFKIAEAEQKSPTWERSTLHSHDVLSSLSLRGRQLLLQRCHWPLWPPLAIYTCYTLALSLLGGLALTFQKRPAPAETTTCRKLCQALGAVRSANGRCDRSSPLDFVHANMKAS